MSIKKDLITTMWLTTTTDTIMTIIKIINISMEIKFAIIKQLNIEIMLITSMTGIFTTKLGTTLMNAKEEHLLRSSSIYLKI